MNRRGKRLTLGVMAVGLAVAVVLTIAHWGTIRDHFEAWWFQLTRKTATIEPLPGLQGTPLLFVGETPETPDGSWERLPAFLKRVANCAARPVIFALEDDSPSVRVRGIDGGARQVATFSESLQVYGLRIVEQRFPRRAWVVIRDEIQNEETPQ